MMCLETYDENTDWGYYITHPGAPMPKLNYSPYTRDTFGIAIKATYGETVDGEPIMIYKQPKECSWKKSQKGCCIVSLDGETYTDGHTYVEAVMATDNLITPVWCNGEWIQTYTLDEVRRNLEATI